MGPIYFSEGAWAPKTNCMGYEPEPKVSLKFSTGVRVLVLYGCGIEASRPPTKVSRIERKWGCDHILYSSL